MHTAVGCQGCKGEVRVLGGYVGLERCQQGHVFFTGKKQTGIVTNFDACRDLSGRRIRHVTQEKQIDTWTPGQLADLRKSAHELSKKELALLERREKDLEKAKASSSAAGTVTKAQSRQKVGCRSCAVLCCCDRKSSAAPVGELGPQAQRCMHGGPEGAFISTPSSACELGEGGSGKRARRAGPCFPPLPEKKTSGEPHLPNLRIKSRVSAISDVLRCLWWAWPLEPN